MVSLAFVISTSRKVFLKYKVSKAYVFGSYAKGTNTSKSDIDFIVEFTNKKLDLDDLVTVSSIKEDLESSLSKEVDLIISPSNDFYKNVEDSIIRIV
eukprot:jgi/Chrzof1/3607/Cz13g02050.t1